MEASRASSARERGYGEKEIRAAARSDERVRALSALYCIGDITAMTLVAEIDDVSRFPSLWVPETRSHSCGPFVFVDKPAEDVASRHSPWEVLMIRGETPRGWRVHVRCPVGPMTLIVREVCAQGGLEMASSEDENAIEPRVTVRIPRRL